MRLVQDLCNLGNSRRSKYVHWNKKTGPFFIWT